MLKPYMRIGIVLALLALVACSPQQGPAVPTVFDLNANAVNAAATATANATLNAPTQPPTRSVPTLPPEFTATTPPEFTPTPTNPFTVATEVPADFNPAGTIYYIYNGDSIAALAGDGSREELIAIDGPYTDLSLSPDGTLLSFVAPGAGSAREVYIASRDGTYVQRISCLGMSNIVHPTWRPDGLAITFAASPAPGAPMDIYIANVFGANQCPQGNEQHVFVPMASKLAGDMAWNPAGDKFFYNNNAVFGLDLTTDQTYSLTMPTGFGPDFALAHSPVGKWLAYLRTERNLQTGETSGELFYFDTTSIKTQPLIRSGGSHFAQKLRWSKDGRLLLIITRNSVSAFDVEFGLSSQLVTGTKFAPEAAFSPDSQQVAYVDGSADNPAIPQVFVVPRVGGTPKPITTHTEGTITDLVWAEG